MGREMALLTPQEVSRQIDAVRPEGRVAEDYLRLFQEVFAAQYEIEQRLRPDDLYPQATREETDRRSGQGLPLIDPEKLCLDEAELLKLLEKISRILEKCATDRKPAAVRLLEAARSGDVSLGELVRALIAGDARRLDEISEKVGADAGEVIFIATALAQPMLRVLALSLGRDVDLEQVLTDRCPVCGGVPLMARIREEDGKRILECSLCSAQWAFKRLRCPFCGNEDGKTLGFFFVEEDAYRVDKCDKCKRYIKTADERKKTKGGSCALLIQDVATLYLDILAAREGYRR